MKLYSRSCTLPIHRRIAIIGEVPHKDDVAAGRVFSSYNSRFLAALLSRAGHSLEHCFLANIILEPQSLFSLTCKSPAVVENLESLRQELTSWKPNIIILLGSLPLTLAKDPDATHRLLPKLYRYKLAKWRGSLFACVNENSPFYGFKCMATYAPEYCVRDHEAKPMLQLDLRRAVIESDFQELRLPKRTLATGLTAADTISRLQGIKGQVALDIEGYVDRLSCISFATDPWNAFIVPFARKDGGNYWSTLEEETAVWRALAAVLENPAIPKVLQNSLYDRFVLHYSYGIRVRGVTEDTMLKHWENYAELEKSLAVQASIYTNEPYYKSERKSDDDVEFWEYCCKDSAVTLEICRVLDKQVLADRFKHYKFNVEMLNPLLYIELLGIRYDIENANKRRDQLLQQLYVLQARFNGMTGYVFPWKSHAELFARAREIHGKVKADIKTWADLQQNCYKESIPLVHRIIELLHHPQPNAAVLGELEDLLECSLNTSSIPQLCHFFYEVLKLPVQMSIPPRGSDAEPAPTTDYEALLKLSRECLKRNDTANHEIIQAVIEIRSLGTRAGMLSITADNDGRIRCGYNVVGSNTGRLSCYESPTGSGYNLQTIPNYTSELEAPGKILGDRDLFLADPGFYFFQCDLAGADGWTVAAYSAMLGDRTLLEDYLYGLKPARNIALMLRGYPVDWKDRESIKEWSKKVKKDDWDYFAGKRVQHGGSYLEGGLTISRNILKDSEGKLYMSPSECDKLKFFFFDRYKGLPLWHKWVGARLRERPYLTAASGMGRQFFGHPDEIITKAVAFEPQANTTYATNLAMLNLWKDPENRTLNGFRITPLHQVHDALCGQFRKEDTAWAISKIKSYFNNPLTIAGQQITIPFEGGYGDSWGCLKAGEI